MSMITFGGTRLFEMLSTWNGRHAERAAMRSELASMDEAVIRDLGFTRSQLKALANKPFWRA
ncbi:MULTISPECIES: DUF1127 domain-containing protein [Pseudovibrio]|uniref:DUF1127 domain-containing protein n=1 Tax=Stappiaceae TaxID=2821832 RepID=UPI002366F40F|nr:MULTISPECIES: DUF1127 domain-containing protein [Pseudovibrio]MDD7910277.1 DUF1127 domain-containing protein [Pseudovibrio exalbescens]MDX5593993.1 DUF1127 domain-containing protein [Pseudovibrio sp. SPO723]